MAVVYERGVRLVRVVELELIVIVVASVAQTHEMTHPRAKVVKRVHSVLVDPAAAAEREEFGERAHDPRDLLLKLIDRLD